MVKRLMRKSIFVSRLSSSTSVNDVSLYIASKLKLNEEAAETFLFHKFNKNPDRVIASFRITPPTEFFDLMLKQDFWPADTLIRQYVPRKFANHLIQL